MLGCERELAAVRSLAAGNGASRQVAWAHEGDLRGVVARLARAHAGDVPIEADDGVDPARQAA